MNEYIDYYDEQPDYFRNVFLWINTDEFGGKVYAHRVTFDGDKDYFVINGTNNLVEIDNVIGWQYA